MRRPRRSQATNDDDTSRGQPNARAENLTDQRILGLRTQDLDALIDDCLGHPGHAVVLGQVGELRRLDRRRPHVRTRCGESICQADRLGTKCSGGCDKDLDVNRPIQSRYRGEALVAQSELTGPGK